MQICKNLSYIQRLLIFLLKLNYFLVFDTVPVFVNVNIEDDTVVQDGSKN